MSSCTHGGAHEKHEPFRVQRLVEPCQRGRVQEVWHKVVLPESLCMLRKGLLLSSLIRAECID